MASRKPALIIGAGIAGAALGQVLKARNIPAILCESRLSGYKRGTALNLSSRSYQPLLDRLGTSSADFQSYDLG